MTVMIREMGPSRQLGDELLNIGTVFAALVELPVVTDVVDIVMVVNAGLMP